MQTKVERSLADTYAGPRTFPACRVARWGDVSAEIEIGTDKNEIGSAKIKNGTDGETMKRKEAIKWTD